MLTGPEFRVLCGAAMDLSRHFLILFHGYPRPITDIVLTCSLVMYIHGRPRYIGVGMSLPTTTLPPFLVLLAPISDKRSERRVLPRGYFKRGAPFWAGNSRFAETVTNLTISRVANCLNKKKKVHTSVTEPYLA